MANLIINVGEFLCEDPSVEELEVVPGSELSFQLTWSSEGQYYQSVVDSGTYMELWYSRNNQPFQQYLGNPIPFNAIDFEINLGQTNNVGDTLDVELRLITSYCTGVGTRSTTVV